LNLDPARRRLTLLFALTGLPVLIYLATLWRLQAARGSVRNQSYRALDMKQRSVSLVGRLFIHGLAIDQRPLDPHR